MMRSGPSDAVMSLASAAEVVMKTLMFRPSSQLFAVASESLTSSARRTLYMVCVQLHEPEVGRDPAVCNLVSQEGTGKGVHQPALPAKGRSGGEKGGGEQVTVLTG